MRIGSPGRDTQLHYFPSFLTTQDMVSCRNPVKCQWKPVHSGRKQVNSKSSTLKFPKFILGWFEFRSKVARMILFMVFLSHSITGCKLLLVIPFIYKPSVRTWRVVSFWIQERFSRKEQELPPALTADKSSVPVCGLRVVSAKTLERISLNWNDLFED